MNAPRTIRVDDPAVRAELERRLRQRDSDLHIERAEQALAEAQIHLERAVNELRELRRLSQEPTT